MSRTVTAMFDSRADAEAAKQRLVAAHIDAHHVDIHDQGSAGAPGAEHGFWASLRNMFVADEDRHAYGEGIRRGGVLLSADVDEDRADEAVRILDEANSVDLDQRTADWRGSGWTGKFAGAAPAAAGTVAAGQRNEEVIPVIEETLRIGKREVERGGARVRSYIRETPVSEQVSLREEHVNVERRPVDRALSEGEVSGDMLRERTVEMKETAEEAVIGKEASVVEEVVVSKTADTRTETVSDTVRRTEVEVDHDPVRKFAGVSGTGASGPGGTPNTAATATPTQGFDADRDTRVAAGVGGTPPLDDGFGTTGRR